MSIISLYKDYYQKSTLFLYPALKIRKGSSVTPVKTYLAWNDTYTTEDKKLVCVYYLRDDNEFTVFERDHLLGNKLFERFMPLEDDKGAYVFDMSSLGDTYDNIVNGKYSKIHPQFKVSIMAFFSSNRGHTAYIESYLYPNKFFNLYSKLLCYEEKDEPAMLDLLISVGELCSPPAMEKETITIKPKALNLILDCVSLSNNL